MHVRQAFLKLQDRFIYNECISLNFAPHDCRSEMHIDQVWISHIIWIRIHWLERKTYNPKLSSMLSFPGLVNPNSCSITSREDLLKTPCAVMTWRNCSQYASIWVALYQQGWMVFQCLVRPWLQKLLSLGLAATSFMLIWSEATIGLGQNPDLSPFSHVRAGQEMYS